MIYADFENTVPKKWNQNPDESYTSKYQKHVACNYRYKLLWVEDKLSKPLGFESNIIKWSAKIVKTIGEHPQWLGAVSQHSETFTPFYPLHLYFSRFFALNKQSLTCWGSLQQYKESCHIL